MLDFKGMLWKLVSMWEPVSFQFHIYFYFFWMTAWLTHPDCSIFKCNPIVLISVQCCLLQWVTDNAKAEYFFSQAKQLASYTQFNLHASTVFQNNVLLHASHVDFCEVSWWLFRVDPVFASSSIQRNGAPISCGKVQLTHSIQTLLFAFF